MKKIILMITMFISVNTLANTKIAVVNLSEVFEKHNKYSEFNQEMSKLMKNNQNKLKIEEDKYIKELTTYQKQKDILSKKAQERKESNLQEMQISLMKLKETLENELKEKEYSLKNKILKNIMKEIKEFNKEKSYDMIIDLESSPFLILKNKEDVTKEFIDYINK